MEELNENQNLGEIDEITNEIETIDPNNLTTEEYYEEFLDEGDNDNTSFSLTFDIEFDEQNTPLVTTYCSWDLQNRPPDNVILMFYEVLNKGILKKSIISAIENFGKVSNDLGYHKMLVKQEAKKFKGQSWIKPTEVRNFHLQNYSTHGIRLGGGED